MSENENQSKNGTEAADFNFEARLGELEQLVTRMEEGELGLEESLRSFEHGVKLVKECQRALEEAEQKVKVLTSPEGDTEDLDLDRTAAE
ncbi:MAG: exodeoxyribonuclease VII small subunit [Gammaproteobacteria bacterium]|nr:exodeoxyribonuclease VII small subunit [Gammaproteobacteria bacterium]